MKQVQQCPVMADNDRCTPRMGNILIQQASAFCVKMIGGLIHQDNVRPVNIQPGKKHLGLFSTAKIFHGHIGNNMPDLPSGKGFLNTFMHVPFIVKQFVVLFCTLTIQYYGQSSEFLCHPQRFRNTHVIEMSIMLRYQVGNIITQYFSHRRESHSCHYS